MRTSIIALLTTLSLASTAFARPSQDAPDRAALEAWFDETLSGCRFVGRFTDDSMAPDAELPRDAYTISDVEKLEGGKWRFTALVEFGSRSVPISIDVDVLWAGDTPVISMTDFKVPLLGTYSARVLIRGDRYAGTWSGSNYGGHLFGRIEPLAKEGSDAGEESGSSDGGEADGDDGSPARDDLDGGDPNQNWPSFRGPDASGKLDGYATPSSWDIESGENVRYRVPIVGLSHASPVIHGNRLFLVNSLPLSGDTAELKVGLYGSIEPVADEGEQRFETLCYDKRDGELLWRRTAFEGTPAVPRHPKGSHAASTPATDGEYVVSFFGSEGLHCWSVDGEPRWSKDFGLLDSGFYMVPSAQWGFASSPVIHEDLVIVQCDVQEGSFIAALSLEDGSEVWRTERDEVPTWSTPTVYIGEDRSQVIANGYKHIGGYDLHTGRELWKLVGGGDIPVPTPIVEGGLVFITNAHGRMAPIYAIDAAAEGTLEMSEDEDAMLWFTRNRGNYMQTPLVVDDILYSCQDTGVLTARDAVTGDVFYSERLGAGRTGFTSSGVACDGKLYFASEEGEVHVVAAGPSFELVGSYPLGEECMASPAISEGTLFYRTRGHLLALSND